MTYIPGISNCILKIIRDFPFWNASDNTIIQHIINQYRICSDNNIVTNSDIANNLIPSKKKLHYLPQSYNCIFPLRSFHL